MAIRIRNPHSVLSALECRPQTVVDVRLNGTHLSGAWKDVVRLAEQHCIPILREADKRQTGRRQAKNSSGGDGRVGSAEATVKELADVTLEELFTSGDDEATGVWIALDQIQDPHNVGAIFRSAAFFGVRGIVLTRDRSAPLNGTVYDVASGGMEHVPFSMQPNLSRAVEQAKQAGLWVLGTSEHAETSLEEIESDRRWLVVLGNEEKGIRRLTRENCDCLCRIVPRGAVESLNVSVACGVLLSELTRKVCPG